MTFKIETANVSDEQEEVHIHPKRPERPLPRVGSTKGGKVVDMIGATANRIIAEVSEVGPEYLSKEEALEAVERFGAFASPVHDAYEHLATKARRRIEKP